MQKVRIQFAYKAGFRRAWAIVSIIWIAIALFVGLRESHASVADAIIGAFAPPIILYILGAATVWIIEGFAKAD